MHGRRPMDQQIIQTKKKPSSEEEILSAEAKKSGIKKRHPKMSFLCNLEWLTHSGNSESSGFKGHKYRNIWHVTLMLAPINKLPILHTQV